jgi:transketolase
MRDALSEALVEAAKSDESVYVLSGDHGYSLFDAFRATFPDRWVNAGVAEQNMVGMAAGMARLGFRPIVYGLSSFVPLRVLEQIKMDVAHDQLPVVFLGDGAGMVYSHLGTSHQCAEDIAVTRVIPHLNVFSPADRIEMQACLKLALELSKPTYIRIGKADLGDVHGKRVDVTDGGLLPVKVGASGSPSLIATGSMVKKTLSIAENVFQDYSVWSAPSLKPISTAQIVEICHSSPFVVTLEEHSCFGGLGSIVAEIAGGHSPVPLLIIGIRDRFSEFCGTYDFLLKEHGLDGPSLIRSIQQFVEGLKLENH